MFGDETVKNPNKDCNVFMVRMLNQLKASEQQALDLYTYILEDIEYRLSNHPEREDIKNCIEEIKKHIKVDESDHWKILDKWGNHFDGIREKKG